MSNSTDTPATVIHSMPEKPEATVEKQSLVKRGVNFVKSHKKTTIAVVALGGLVGVSALAGRATAPSPVVFQPLELTVGEDELRDVEETDTTVA